MKKTFSIKNIVLSSILLLASTGCTKLDQDFYSEVRPEKFFKTAKDIKSVVYRPFTHARWYVGEDRWMLQEYTADNFAISTKGRHWYNGGENERFHYHRWTPDDAWISETWRGTLMGISLALDAIADLSKLDYTKFDLTNAEKENDLTQLNTLAAYHYLRGLDYFGGLPIYTTLETEPLARNTAQETFNHVERLLKAAIDKLPAKTAGTPKDENMHKAAAAAMLAQLYFNAESYIGKNMYSECLKICRDIVDQKYGFYQLDANWFGPHSFSNNDSPEIIWSVPSAFNKLEYNWFYKYFYHYNTNEYFKGSFEGWNGAHLTPSKKPDGTLYDYTLGSPFEKFDATDLRKKPYKYLGAGKYEGMFIVGAHLTPEGKAIVGGEEYKDKPLNFVDQVARFSEVGAGKKYANISALPSKMSEGEENTGIRLVKVPIPTVTDKRLTWEADVPVIRLTEVYYMLAECEFRLGNPGIAANLFNEVRKRNFANGVDPNPVTAANINKDRILKEWSIEFLGEGRRRTDLIRWDVFTEGEWWDHKASKSKHLNRFPIPNGAISGNNKLTQNEGYN